MHFRSVLSGTLALLLVSSVAAPAVGNEQGTEKSGFSFRLPTLGIFGDKKKQDQVQYAQDGTGSTALQEQLRQMNGKIEELNFQVLQMQEQIRKQQEDNEFRFQQLEGGSQGAQQPREQKKSDATTGTDRSVAEAPATQAPADAGTPPAGGQEVIVESPTGEPGAVIPGTPPKTFGTITVDKNGNVIEGKTQAHAPAQNAAPVPGDQAGKSDDTVVAALPATDDPEELYRNSYQFILSGDYGTAEQGFRDHIARFPKDAKTADAHYWLGESLLGQQKYRDAAETFLAASKDYPKAKKAPDMLLKLGVSLVGLNQRDVACATFGEIGKRYPNVSSALKERVKQERALAAC
ncbi:tol-pal system protein YbgF [Mesorhizobium sp.]|uniref:tol-pal system protein YbgF n=1 Tax=Mesorhizobium sp. TaxID=1871066 RepID=UPI000FE4F104|nr:tol-pal system protein YbgF [Mesorhizobium sp.]RWK37664.1 MAG: tol-pal system protein YbgF [Mesorhizobium sp.]RWK63735.1 MAG: tol-pal system protein YbgF [Mesorhizobium sp.]RWK72128.1 MAG: tol-pal system protein YbgF [Mesorhizobium sp.]RWK84624.1 MAG: tol-pal system protein YbgF [Mesorhizobium sp.]RWL01949.1 MAG: tol-pal system protein YbgF [Mesorhizobium sp.]